MPFKIFLDPEELTFLQWSAIVLLIALVLLFFCNWLNIAIWPY